MFAIPMAAIKASFTLYEGAQLQGPLQSTRPVLYTHTLCPYAQRVFLTMLLKVGGCSLRSCQTSNRPANTLDYLQSLNCAALDACWQVCQVLCALSAHRHLVQHN
jgi:hypothetical protein